MARLTKALITFGTPYRGSLDAVGYVANGYKKAFLDLTELLLGCPSVYELFPIYKAVQVRTASGIGPTRSSCRWSQRLEGFADSLPGGRHGLPGRDRGGGGPERPGRRLPGRRTVVPFVGVHQDDRTRPRCSQDGRLTLSIGCRGGSRTTSPVATAPSPASRPSLWRWSRPSAPRSSGRGARFPAERRPRARRPGRAIATVTGQAPGRHPRQRQRTEAAPSTSSWTTPSSPTRTS